MKTLSLWYLSNFLWFFSNIPTTMISHFLHYWSSGISLEKLPSSSQHPRSGNRLWWWGWNFYCSLSPKKLPNLCKVPFSVCLPSIFPFLFVFLLGHYRAISSMAYFTVFISTAMYLWSVGFLCSISPYDEFFKHSIKSYAGPMQWTKKCSCRSWLLGTPPFT